MKPISRVLNEWFVWSNYHSELESAFLKGLGYSDEEASALIDRFNAGDGHGFLFHYTNPKAAKMIAFSMYIKSSRLGFHTITEGIHCGSTPKPSIRDIIFRWKIWPNLPFFPLNSLVRLPIPTEGLEIKRIRLNNSCLIVVKDGLQLP
ncbi:hypothetical protein [Paludibacterium sp. B53371]|uniref:hypothetical protein n=1 Tax=Paludibacterium sp. B53371 TaxID=2806263 RepID=UPI001C05A396|nr:hypothetical protein [Paludibacterium sp. B53371]